MVQKRRCVLWAKAHLKWTVLKWKKCSIVRRFKMWHSYNGRRVPWAKEEGDLPEFYKHSIQNPASRMVWEGISAYTMGSLHDLEDTMNAERFIQVLEQHMLPSRWHLFHGRPCVFQLNNAKPHTAAITTAWLRSRRVRACLQSRSFTYREHLAHH